MILTLTRLGEHLSQGSDIWDDVIDTPKTDPEKENLVASIIINIDEQTIYSGEVSAYSKRALFEYKHLSIKGGNNKATYVCCETGKLTQLEKTLFGKIDNKGNMPVKGEFQEYIDNRFPSLQSSLLYQVLAALFTIRDKFQLEKWHLPETLYSSIFGNDKGIGNSKLVLTYIAVVSEKMGIKNATPLSALQGFEEFVHLDRFTKPTSTEKKMSYATGKIKENVIGVDFPNRYSINYMFVETTLNHAAGFNKNNFSKNYQINAEEQLFLERASDHLLKTQQISIAGIPHCIIPQFLSNKEVDFDTVLEETYKKSEFLFQRTIFERSIIAIADELNENDLYWINFLAFESDGNSFKTINLIKDVSKIHFENVIQAFKEIDAEFKGMEDVVDWDNVTTEFSNQKNSHSFNLNTIYQLIPLRKDKEKKNEALFIFKSLLEKRNIDIDILFKHFTDLILCHRFGRYEAYKNVKRFNDDAFVFAIRDAVYKYLAFMKVLTRLKLSNYMEETTQQLTIEIVADEKTNIYQQRIDTFFERMQYKDHQKALFYLGRMLNSVTYLQMEKKKTVLDKLNFNGMERNDIQRLRSSLLEKAKQYNDIERVIFADARFNEHFDYNSWKVNPHEALFFILNGYSFGIHAKTTKN